uniref:Uncharacterized protein n=1 Tax=Glossina pallidipes TaxID=7398 RepID=A0A1B0A7Z1_GLOPL
MSQSFAMILLIRVLCLLTVAFCLCAHAAPMILTRCHLFCENKRDYVCATHPSWNYMNCSWLNECMVRLRNCEYKEGWRVINRGFFVAALKDFNGVIEPEDCRWHSTVMTLRQKLRLEDYKWRCFSSFVFIFVLIGMEESSSLQARTMRYVVRIMNFEVLGMKASPLDDYFQIFLAWKKVDRVECKQTSPKCRQLGLLS